MGFEINLCGSFVSRLTAGFRIFISLARWGCKATQMCWMAGYVTLLMLVQVDQRLELAHRKTLDKYDIFKKYTQLGYPRVFNMVRIQSGPRPR